MVKLSEYRGGSTLKCADLGQKEHLVQIESIREEEVGEERERKLVARFEGKSKGLVLNDTNLETLEMAFGEDSSDLIGAQVILFVDPDVKYQIGLVIPQRDPMTPLLAALVQTAREAAPGLQS